MSGKQKKRPLENIWHRRISRWSAFVIHNVLYRNQEIADKKNIKKILVVSLDYIGDNILSSPVFPVLKEFFPNAVIEVMAGEWTEQIHKRNPYVSDIIVYNCNFLNRSDKKWGLRKKCDIIRDVARRKFDVIIDIRGSFGTLLLAIMKASRYRADLRALFVQKKIYRLKKIFLRTNDTPLVDHRRPYQVLQLLRQIGVYKTAQPEVSFFLSQEDRESLKDILITEGIDLNKRIVSIHPCAADSLKLWKNERWARACDELYKTFGVQIVISGGPKDSRLTQDIIAQMTAPSWDLAGKMTLMQMSALVELSSLCICLDSGPMHIAGALKVPVVGLFGADHPLECAPWTDRCRLLYHDSSDIFRMQLITVDEVLEAAACFLKN